MYLPEVKQALDILEQRGVQLMVSMRTHEIEAMNSLVTFLRGTLSDDMYEQDLHALLMAVSVQLNRMHRISLELDAEEKYGRELKEKGSRQ